VCATAIDGPIDAATHAATDSATGAAIRCVENGVCADDDCCTLVVSTPQLTRQQTLHQMAQQKLELVMARAQMTIAARSSCSGTTPGQMQQTLHQTAHSLALVTAVALISGWTPLRTISALTRMMVKRRATMTILGCCPRETLRQLAR